MEIETTLILSIIGWIITICIAIYTVKNGKEDTDRKIAAIDASTSKQVESLKQLAFKQCEIAFVENDLSLWNAKYRNLFLSKKMSDCLERENLKSSFGQEWAKNSKDSYEIKEIEYELEYYNNLIAKLQYSCSRIESIKNGNTA